MALTPLPRTLRPLRLTLRVWSGFASPVRLIPAAGARFVGRCNTAVVFDKLAYCPIRTTIPRVLVVLVFRIHVHARMLQQDLGHLQVARRGCRVQWRSPSGISRHRIRSLVQDQLCELCTLLAQGNGW